jgi:hypothetical protein
MTPSRQEAGGGGAADDPRDLLRAGEDAAGDVPGGARGVFGGLANLRVLLVHFLAHGRVAATPAEVLGGAARQVPRPANDLAALVVGLGARPGVHELLARALVGRHLKAPAVGFDHHPDGAEVGDEVERVRESGPLRALNDEVERAERFLELAFEIGGHGDRQ